MPRSGRSWFFIPEEEVGCAWRRSCSWPDCSERTLEEEEKPSLLYCHQNCQVIKLKQFSYEQVSVPERIDPSCKTSKDDRKAFSISKRMFFVQPIECQKQNKMQKFQCVCLPVAKSSVRAIRVNTVKMNHAIIRCWNNSKYSLKGSHDICRHKGHKRR